MPLFRPNELLSFLKENNLRAKKTLSQFFIIDDHVVQKILHQAEISKGDYVLEIGPGPGVFTEALLKNGAEVIAVEKDRDFANHLSRLGDVDIHTQDIRFFLFEKLKRKAKVISNLPFHLTFPILKRLAVSRLFFNSVTAILPIQVAQKIIAKPKEEGYGLLTPFLNFYMEVFYVCSISRNCFYPKPNVDAAAFHFQFKEPQINQEGAFFSFVEKVFQQRRKCLSSSLSDKMAIDTCLKPLGFSSKARPEELPLEAFLALWKNYSLN